MVEDKGALTALEAILVLLETNPGISVHLSLLGTGNPAYTARLKDYISANNLGQHVQCHDWVQRDDVPAFMADFDVLVLPTIRPEALSRTVQEAMAMGLVVASTPTGGSPEIVSDGVTGLLFPPGDAAQLATCLHRFYSDVALCDRLTAAARQLVREKFTIQTTAASIESHLQEWMSLAVNCN